jgi:hypothetical protein
VCPSDIPGQPPSSSAAAARARRSAAQARWRARSKACAALYGLELDAADLEWLIFGVRYLAEADAADRDKVAAAVRRLIKDAQK